MAAPPWQSPRLPNSWVLSAQHWVLRKHSMKGQIISRIHATLWFSFLLEASTHRKAEGKLWLSMPVQWQGKLKTTFQNEFDDFLPSWTILWCRSQNQAHCNLFLTNYSLNFTTFVNITPQSLGLQPFRYLWSVRPLGASGKLYAQKRVSLLLETSHPFPSSRGAHTHTRPQLILNLYGILPNSNLLPFTDLTHCCCCCWGC